jgi:hypothetical protein
MEDEQTQATRAAAETEFSAKFLGFDYPETKDLCKQFLTLISGLLVFSVTFGDKYVGQAPFYCKLLLVTSWFFLLLAIIGAGLGLYEIFVAGQYASHHPEKGTSRDRPWRISFAAMNCAGISFVVGLVLLILSGVSGVLSRHPQ